MENSYLLPAGIIDNLKEIDQFWSQNDIELHVKGAEKRGTLVETGKSGYSLAGFDHYRREMIVEKKRVIYHDLEDMV